MWYATKGLKAAATKKIQPARTCAQCSVNCDEDVLMKNPEIFTVFIYYIKWQASQVVNRREKQK